MSRNSLADVAVVASFSLVSPQPGGLKKKLKFVEENLAVEYLQVGVDEGLGCGEAGLVLPFSRILAARCRSGSAFALSPIAS
jgi:hypothetical protein